MSAKCPKEDLDRLARDQLPPGEAEAVATHAASCAACQRELSWLRTERELLARRRSQPAPLSPLIWKNVEAQVALSRRRRRWFDVRALWSWQPQWLGFSFAAAAAVALAVVTGTGHLSQWVVGEGQQGEARIGGVSVLPAGDPASGGPRVTPIGLTSEDGAADEAMERAEQSYKQAFTELERAYERRRGQMSPEQAQHYAQQFNAVRRLLKSAGKGAAKGADRDVEARVQRLDAYSAYMHAIQTTSYEPAEVYP